MDFKNSYCKSNEARAAESYDHAVKLVELGNLAEALAAFEDAEKYADECFLYLNGLELSGEDFSEINYRTYQRLTDRALDDLLFFRKRVRETKLALEVAQQQAA